MTQDDITKFSKEVDSLLVGADSVPEMYRKLNTLRTNGRGGWQLLRSPWWVKGVLVAVLVRPDPDQEPTPMPTLTEAKALTQSFMDHLTSDHPATRRQARDAARDFLRQRLREHDYECNLDALAPTVCGITLYASDFTNGQDIRQVLVDRFNQAVQAMAGPSNNVLCSVIGHLLLDGPFERDYYEAPSPAADWRQVQQRIAEESLIQAKAQAQAQVEMQAAAAARPAAPNDPDSPKHDVIANDGAGRDLLRRLRHASKPISDHAKDVIQRLAGLVPPAQFSHEPLNRDMRERPHYAKSLMEEHARAHLQSARMMSSSALFYVTLPGPQGAAIEVAVFPEDFDDPRVDARDVVTARYLKNLARRVLC